MCAEIVSRDETKTISANYETPATNFWFVNKLRLCELVSNSSYHSEQSGLEEMDLGLGELGNGREVIAVRGS